MRTPFASELATAPGGAVVAWIVNDRGVRNVWVAEAPGWGARRLTAYEKEDGQELGELEFAPEGRRLVYVRGGSPNRRDEAPNPTSDPRGTEQAVWVVPVAGGEPKKLGEGHSPAVAPTGDRVAFVHKGEAKLASLDGASEAGDRVVFPWEADGWTHLYSVPVAGGEATLLTPGDFEVEHVALSTDRTRVFYSSNQGDVDRRHVWQVAVAGGRPEAVTRGEGLEWSLSASASGAVLTAAT